MKAKRRAEGEPGFDEVLILGWSEFIGRLQSSFRSGVRERELDRVLVSPGAPVLAP